MLVIIHPSRRNLHKKSGVKFASQPWTLRVSIVRMRLMKTRSLIVTTVLLSGIHFALGDGMSPGLPLFSKIDARPLLSRPAPVETVLPVITPENVRVALPVVAPVAAGPS